MANYRIVLSLKNGNVFKTDQLDLNERQARELTEVDLLDFLNGEEAKVFWANGDPVVVHPSAVAMAKVAPVVQE